MTGSVVVYFFHFGACAEGVAALLDPSSSLNLLGRHHTHTLVGKQTSLMLFLESVVSNLESMMEPL